MGNETTEKQEVTFRPLEELTLMDDYMFAAVMEDPANLQPLLESVLEIPISNIVFVESQKTEKEGYRSRGIRLDLYVEDGVGSVYNVEVQTSDKRNLPKRMRYYQSVMDINILAPGVDYRNLRRSFVIFLCNYDPFEEGRYLYTFENRCLQDLQLAFGDETIKVIVNTRGTIGRISERLKEIVVYLNEGKAAGDYTRQLENAVQLVKTSEERRHEYMVRMIRDMELREEGREEGKEIGIAIGVDQGKIIGAVDTMRDDGKDDETIRQRLMTKYHLSEKEAESYIRKPVSA